MFERLFNKKQPRSAAEEAALVEQIHHEFMTAADANLAEARRILGQSDETAVSRAQRLAQLGFFKSEAVKKAESEGQIIAMNREIASTIEMYENRYPNYKFIREEDVVRICNKYKLVCGPVSAFTADVPEKNLREIEAFNLVGNDRAYKVTIDKVSFRSSAGAREKVIIEEAIAHIGAIYLPQGECSYSSSREGAFLNKIVEYAKANSKVSEDNIRSAFSSASVTSNAQPCNFEICAPATDFDMKDMKQKGNFLVKTQKTLFETQPVPDPIVLQRVGKGGFLIVTAWGPEASDPLVVNNKMN